MMKFLDYFKTPIYVEQLDDWVDPINKVCDKYLEDIKNKEDYKERVKKKGSDFGEISHSFSIVEDPNLKKYVHYMGQRSWEFLDSQGFDLSNHTCVYTECWVQEFPKDGGGHHNSHVHPNNHVSGFLYLKRDKDGPVPVLHDPRPGSMISGLPQKNYGDITYASDSIHWKPTPGTLILIPSYIYHQYSLGGPNESFRFIHFNIQAIQNRFMKEVK